MNAGRPPSDPRAPVVLSAAEAHHGPVRHPHASKPGERPLALVGGGDHAVVVIDAALRSGWQVLGCFAEHYREGLVQLGHDPVAATAEQLAEIALMVAFAGKPGEGIRAAAIARLGGVHWATVIHPSAVVSPSATIGQGVFIGANAVIGPEADIGDHCIINTAAVVEHHCRIGAATHVASGAVLGGGVQVGALSWVGLGSRVRDHLDLGPHVVVGMGAVVVRDVPAHTTVVGNPAHVLEKHG